MKVRSLSFGSSRQPGRTISPPCLKHLVKPTRKMLFLNSANFHSKGSGFMRRLRGALKIALIFWLATLGLALAAAPLAWAQTSNCMANVALTQGQAKTLQSVAHSMLEKSYPFLVGQAGAEVSMTSLQAIKEVRRLPEEAKGDMIGLLIFEVELSGGAMKKLGLNGATFLVGQGPGGEQRIPFAQIEKITISCP
jgi:hypothetical protein